MAGPESRRRPASCGLSEGNQRVLLHRARPQVRSALEEHYVAPALKVA